MHCTDLFITVYLLFGALRGSKQEASCSSMIPATIAYSLLFIYLFIYSYLMPAAAA
jgi:hypothetical protein